MLITTSYTEQETRLPKIGRYILAQFDDEGVIVYQAYRPAIGNFAATHGYFGGDHFSLNRMSWVKPNFLWILMDLLAIGQKTLVMWIYRKKADI